MCKDAGCVRVCVFDVDNGAASRKIDIARTIRAHIIFTSRVMMFYI